jgi:hypothetical protein
MSGKLVNASSATGLYSEQLRDALYQLELLDEDCPYPNQVGEVPEQILNPVSSGYLFGRLAIRDHICEALIEETGKASVTRQSVNGYRRQCDDFLIRSGDLVKTVASSLDNRLKELFQKRADNISARSTKLAQYQTNASAGDLT